MTSTWHRPFSAIQPTTCNCAEGQSISFSRSKPSSKGAEVSLIFLNGLGPNLVLSHSLIKDFRLKSLNMAIWPRSRTNLTKSKRWFLPYGKVQDVQPAEHSQLKTTQSASSSLMCRTSSFAVSFFESSPLNSLQMTSTASDVQEQTKTLVPSCDFCWTEVNKLSQVELAKKLTMTATTFLSFSSSLLFNNRICTPVPSPCSQLYPQPRQLFIGQSKLFICCWYCIWIGICICIGICCCCCWTGQALMFVWAGGLGFKEIGCLSCCWTCGEVLDWQEKFTFGFCDGLSCFQGFIREKSDTDIYKSKSSLDIYRNQLSNSYTTKLVSNYIRSDSLIAGWGPGWAESFGNALEIIILLHEYLSMQYNQIPQLTVSSSHRSITLRPPPALDPQPRATPAQSTRPSLRQLKTSKPSLKPAKPALSSRLFYNEGQQDERTNLNLNIEEMLKVKLRLKVSEYENMDDGKGEGKLVGKKLHKGKKEKGKDGILGKFGETFGGKRFSEGLLFDSRYDELFNYEGNQKVQVSKTLLQGQAGQATMDRSRQFEMAHHRFRSTSVMALGRVNNQKRVKLVLKSNKKSTSISRLPEPNIIKNLIYTPNQNLEICCCHLRISQQMDQSSLNEPSPQKQQTCPDFRVKKKRQSSNINTNIRKSSRLKVSVQQEQSKHGIIEAWRDKQLENNYNGLGNSLRQSEMEMGEDSITEFVERQMNIS